MGGSSNGGGDQENDMIEAGGLPIEPPPASKAKKLKLIPLIFLIYFEVSGGPFGEEPAVQAAGPLWAIAGFLIFPVIWSIPEALVTAELATAYPGDGGFVVWAEMAFGPFWGFLMGWWRWLSGVISNAAIPVLCFSYLTVLLPAFGHGRVRDVGNLILTIVLSFLNFTGLSIVGWTAVILGVMSLFPFILVALISIPRIKPSRWLVGNQGNMDRSLYFNTLFWNLNFWDNASTMAGEVEKPQRTYPRALLWAVVMTVLGYIVPLLSILGALELDRDLWGDGYLAEGAGLIGGAWLKYLVEVGAALSTVGLFEAQLSSVSFQLLGMAEMGILPSIMATRSPTFNTPTWGILISACVTLGLSYASFENIISAANFVYSLGMLLEFASFLWLRRKFPLLNRPYRVPLGIPGLICVGLVPVAFLFYIMTLANALVYILASSATVLGVVCYFFMIACKRKNWIEFSVSRKGETGGIRNPMAENRMDAGGVHNSMAENRMDAGGVHNSMAENRMVAGEETQIRVSGPSNGTNLAPS